jgi:hypothetical protein
VACDDGQFDQLLEVLQGISTGVGGCGCGGGSRGTGDQAVPINTFDPEDIPGSFPEGFEDLAEYEAHRCRAAWRIVLDLISDLQSIAGLTYGATSIPSIVEIMVGVLLTPFPHDDIIGLVALLVYTIFAYTFLVETSAIMFIARNDLVCTLVNGGSVSASGSAFLQHISDLLDSETSWTSGQKEFVLTAIQFFLGPDSLNRLVESVPVLDGETDCSECGNPWNFTVTVGDWDEEAGDLDSAEFQVHSGAQVSGPLNYWEVRLEPFYNIECVNVSASLAPAASGGAGWSSSTMWWFQDCVSGFTSGAANTPYINDTIWETTEGSTLVWRSGVEFTATISVSEP